jgi:ligand-binding sensor domain-containing protein
MDTIRHKYLHSSALLIALSLLLLTGKLAGQSVIVTHYHSEDGIAHDNVRDIAQDSSGFIWMATWDGLTRFDGFDFRNYYHNPEDSTTIPYFSVSRVIIDSRDNLWVVTDDRQLSILNRATDMFTIVDKLDDHPLSDVYAIEAGPDGCVYFLLKDNILLYDPATGKTNVFMLSGEKSDSVDYAIGPYNLMFDRDWGHIWVTGPVIVELNLIKNDTGGDGKAVASTINRIERGRDRVGIFFAQTGQGRITHDRDGRVWLATTTGLFRYEKEKYLFSEYTGSKRDLNFADSMPVMYYDHGEGTCIWLPGADSVLTLPTEDYGMPLMMLADNSSVLWISQQTTGGTPDGISKIVINPYVFTHINPLPARNSEFNVFGITGDNQGNLWLAARDRNYLVRIDKGGSVTRVNPLSTEDQIRLWHPRSFLVDTEGLWVGYFFKELIYIDNATGRIDHHYPSHMVHTTCFEGDGNILIGDMGIVRYDPVRRISERLASFPDSVGVFTFFLDHQILWAGCSHSLLCRFDLRTNDYEFIRLSKAVSNLEDICPDEDGHLWIAMLGGGVCHYNPVTGSRQFYTTSSGLSNNTDYSLIRDQEGNFWVSTNDGISVINPVTGLIRSFSENDGLHIHEFNSDAAYESGDGTFYFGGVTGAVKFKPEQLLRPATSERQNSILITKLEVTAEKRLLDEPVYKTDTIILHKGDDDFHISFVIPEYRYPEKIRYRYRLDGVSSEWSYTDHTDRNISYANLKPRWYKLEIQATDINGAWSGQRTVAIRIKPFFYQTVLFRIGLPALIILLLVLQVLYIIRRIRQRERRKRDELRQQALRGQMNPHFIFNSLNSINYFISNNDRLSANRYIADFSRLIRRALNNLDEDFVRLSDELGSIEEYLEIEHLRFGDRFDYTMITDPEIIPETVNVSPGLIQPFIENAIWHGIMGLHGRKGMIKVITQRRDGKLICTVEDDGIGRKKSAELKDRNDRKKSRGMALAIERLRIISSLQKTSCQIRVTDLNPDLDETGTIIEIELPEMAK